MCALGMHDAPNPVTIVHTPTHRRRRRRGHCPLGSPRAALIQPTFPCPRCEDCDFCTTSSASASASASSSSCGCVVGRALVHALGTLTFLMFLPPMFLPPRLLSSQSLTL